MTPATAQDEQESNLPKLNPAQTHAPVQKSSSSNAVATVFTNIPGHPTAPIPGLPGFEFGTSGFERPFGSPNGNWILAADSNDPSSLNDEVVLVNGTAVLKEGDPAPWDATSNMGPFDTRLQINDAGDYAFCVNTTAAANDDFTIVVNPGPVFNVVAQEGSPTASIPTSTYDDTLDSVMLLGNGTAGMSADGIDGGTITTTTDEILELGATLIGQENVTIPTGQLGGATEFAENFDFENNWADPTGTNVLWQGDLTGATANDDVVVLNNNVVLQEGVIIPGSGFVDPTDAGGVVEVSMDGGGNWYARGDNANTFDDWVVRNGVVVAAVGQAVVPGSSELWDDGDYTPCFFAQTGNSLGDYVVAGVTDNDSAYNGVVVWNGVQVVLREGDPIDLDNNGQFDDGAYFNTFGNDDLYLSDANELYFVATIRSATGSDLGDGFFRTQINACTGGELVDYGTGCAGSGANAPQLNALGCATPGGALTLAITDGAPSSVAILFLGVAPTSLPIDGGCTLHTNPLAQLVLPLDATGSLTIQAVVPAATPAATAYLQVFNADPGTFWGYRASRGVEINIQ